MFTLLCTLAAGLLAVKSVKEYQFISIVIFLEFLLHIVVYYFGKVQTDILNSSLLYVTYMAIESVALYFMYKFQSHFIISVLLFLNIFCNFVMILQYINVATMVTYENYLAALNIYYAAETTWIYIVGTIMIFELIYLLGINTYVAGYIRKNGPIKRGDIDYLDRLFSVRRNLLSGGVV